MPNLKNYYSALSFLLLLEAGLVLLQVVVVVVQILPTAIGWFKHKRVEENCMKCFPKGISFLAVNFILMRVVKKPQAMYSVGKIKIGFVYVYTANIYSHITV